MRSLILAVISIISLVGMSGCSRHEYAQNYISPDAKDFAQYQNEAKKRPSPPARVTQNVKGTEIFITYCQPSVKGRNIWNNLVEYDKIWRTGANEATVLTVDKQVSIGGVSIKPGNYALYTIPNEDKWTVILNARFDVWGAYDYDSKLDIVRFEVETSKTDYLQEKMKFDLNQEGVVTFNWEYLSFQFPIVTS